MSNLTDPYRLIHISSIAAYEAVTTAATLPTNRDGSSAATTAHVNQITRATVILLLALNLIKTALRIVTLIFFSA